MNFFDRLSAFFPLRKKATSIEYFFALDIGVEKLTAALWVIEDNHLKILDIATGNYSSNDQISSVCDRLLDQVLGLREIEPTKILFGVPHSWLSDENLKEENLRILKNLLKELELTPMAYVATSHSLIHFLEKEKGVPATAILVGFEKDHLAVTVVRAGKLDGVKIATRGENSALDIEKALLSFTGIETLPSKILLYGSGVKDLKNQLLAFSWMSNLSFLHFPKIEVLEDNIEIKSVCLAGGSEINKEIILDDLLVEKQERSEVIKDSKIPGEEESKETIEEEKVLKPAAADNFGFIVGDVSEQSENSGIEPQSDQEKVEEKTIEPQTQEQIVEESLTVKDESPLEIEDFENQDNFAPPPQAKKSKLNISNFIPKRIPKLTPLIVVLAVGLLLGAYLFLSKANVKIYVEPKILEKDAEIIADPNLKNVDEDAKLIPAQVVETENTGTEKDTASGKKQIGDPAKGTIVIYNKTSQQQQLSKGTKVNTSSGFKFSLDTNVTIASQSASDSGITFGKTNTTVTAAAIGADGNLSSGTEFTITGQQEDKLTAKAEGNFSGGTSKDVTVVSSEDQQRLLAKLTSKLRGDAQQKLQEKYPDKKILQEALAEQIISKKYNKNINDQASEFSLTMTIKFKGTAFEDKDLKLIVSKLVDTQVPEGYILDLSQTETQSDISKLEKDGRLIFLARFKAKLLPKIDVDNVSKQIVFKTPGEVSEILKKMDNILGSEIVLSPNVPKILQRLPLLSNNIKIEVGLK